MQQFRGRTAVVTGAGSGIGLGLARTFAREGMQVALIDDRPDALPAAAAQVQALGGTPITVTGDVSDRAQMTAAAARVEAAFGAVHVLCNNAGVLIHGKPILDVTPAEWEWIVRINLFGVINGVDAFLPRMLAHGDEGHVVNTSSIGGFQINPPLRTGAYSVTKYAVLALTETLAIDLAGTRIGVSVLAPAAVNTAIYNSAASRLRPPDAAPPEDQTPDVLRAGLSGDDVGRRVIAAIRDGDFFIFTHPDTRAWLDARHERIRAGVDACDRWVAQGASK